MLTTIFTLLFLATSFADSTSVIMSGPDWPNPDTSTLLERSEAGARFRNPSCPKTISDWNTVRNELLASLLDVDSLIEGPLGNWGCDTSLLNGCMQNATYIPLQYLGRNKWTLYRSLAERERYLSLRTIAQLPEEFLGQELLDSLRDVSLWDPKSATPLEAALAKINSIRQTKNLGPIAYAIFDDAMAGSLDGSGAGRIMLMANGVLRDPNQTFFVTATISGMGDQYSAVALQKHKSGKFAVYFKDYQRTYNGVRDRPGATGDCRKCHISPLLPIPEPKRVGGIIDVSKINFINDEMKVWNQKMPTDPTFPREWAGPGIGEAPAGEKEADRRVFVRECVKKSGLTGTPDEVERISEAMKCSRCHNGKKREKIYWTQMGQVSKYISTLQTMPPRAKLELDERLALYNCLEDLWSKSYWAWLIGPRCEAPNNSLSTF